MYANKSATKIMCVVQLVRSSKYTISATQSASIMGVVEQLYKRYWKSPEGVERERIEQACKKQSNVM